MYPEVYWIVPNGIQMMFLPQSLKKKKEKRKTLSIDPVRNKKF